MVFLVIFFGAMHGLFLLPVLLSLFGPGSCLTWTGKDDGSDVEVDDSLDERQLEKPFSQSYYMQYPTMDPTAQRVFWEPLIRHTAWTRRTWAWAPLARIPRRAARVDCSAVTSRPPPLRTRQLSGSRPFPLIIWQKPSRGSSAHVSVFIF
ncbi:uncharacterized protein [Drosophila kikkawai]|uniref:Uncharacterized protein n=1 Tax=Drosophila kikkawai TaxID=30033 RepID=A0ABM4GP89_DROKI|nr:uncharacterized protein LOC121502370 [Drosophila kikkawai]